MRPTIPLADWRIAVDLDATRALLAATPAPVCNRECEWCRNWSVAHETALPTEIAHDLRRLGLDPAKPVDLYAYREPEVPGGPIQTRVRFRVAGRVMRGPSVWIEWEEFGAILHYSPLKSAAGVLEPGLAVWRESAAGAQPRWQARYATSVLEIDFRIPVAWMLPEPAPEVHWTPPSLRGRKTRRLSALR